MNDNDASRADRFVWPAFVGLILSVWGYWTFQPPLKSSRPVVATDSQLPEPPAPKGIRSISSRLWEDPLVPAHLDFKSGHGVDGGIDETRALMKAVKDGVVERKLDLVCMPVFVVGGSHASDVEERIRMQHAVISGLSAAGYRLRYPDRASYVQVPIDVRAHSGRPAVPIQLTIPVKLYGPDEVRETFVDRPPQADVLVLWINESQLGVRPLSCLAQILEQMFRDVSPRPRLRIVGPARSDTLLTMAEEWESNPPIFERAEHDDLCEWWRTVLPKFTNSPSPIAVPHAPADKPGHLHAFFKRWGETPKLKPDGSPRPEADVRPMLLSPRATVAARGLNDEKKPVLYRFLRLRESDKEPLDVVRVVGDDVHLVNALSDELALRDAWPNVRQPHKTVVLVTERDTLFSRSIVTLFRNRIAATMGTTEDALPDDYLKVFTYLQGIDGRLPTDRPKAASPDDPKRPDGRDTSIADQSVVPEGRSQLDYLQRLRGELDEFHTHLKANGYPGVTCIGVVGTDVYDQLLVLRALRTGFPEALFFTTDLHAHFSAPGEVDHTRNMVVASHFGLRLSDRLQRGVGTFRDSYQTATYLAALMAVDDERARELIWDERQEPIRLWSDDSAAGLRPLIFEIGQNSAYQLTTVASSMPSQRHVLNHYEAFDGSAHAQAGLTPTVKVHPPALREHRWINWWVVGGIVALVAIFLALSYSWFETARNGILVATAPILVVARSIVRGKEDDRSSPAAKAKVGSEKESRSGAENDAETKCDDQAKRLGLAEAWGIVVAALVWAWLAWCIVGDHLSSNGEPSAPAAGISVWPTVILRMLAISVAIAFFVVAARNLAQNTADVSEDLDSLARFLPSPTSERESEKLEPKYPFWRRADVVPLAIVAVLASWLFYSLLLNPRLPYRGNRSWAWANATTFLGEAFAVAAFLQFAHVAANARRFVRGLVKNCDLHDLAARSPDLFYKKIKVIEMRTNVIMKLFAFPFVILLILILSVHPRLDFASLAPGRVVVFAVAFGVVLLASFTLKKTALDVRRKIEEALQNERTRIVLQDPSILPGRVRRGLRQVEHVLAEVSRSREGSLRPLLDSSVLRWVLGGTGGLIATDWLFKSF